MKKDNHYVPKLILRRFDEKINTYNIKEKNLKKDANLSKAFSSKLLYSQEIENMLNYKLENEFAKILDNKILKPAKLIELTRTELNITKKFLLIAMFRVINGEEFMQHRNLEVAKALKESIGFEEKNTDDLTTFEYWLRTMKCILESPNIMDIKNHPEATNKAVQWAYNFNAGYLSVWDSKSSGEDFIVIDNGMTSEHEVTRFMPPINNDAIKVGYMLEKILNPKKTKEEIKRNAYYYFPILMANNFMTENFYMFSISNNRTLVLINPFYRLYDESAFDKTRFLPIPDVWPSKLRDRSLISKNQNKYINGDKEALQGNTDPNDMYIYKVKQMKPNDVIYVNCLGLDRIDNLLGFTDINKIKRSLSVYAQIQGRNDYSGLMKSYEDKGVKFTVNDKIKRIANHAKLSSTTITKDDEMYISYYYKMNELGKILKR